MTTPLTPFEETGEPATLAQEQAFLAQVQADTNRVQQILLGHTDDGSPFHAVILGDPAPTSPSGLECALIVASQHGYEPSAREAALQTIRNYAYTEDQEALAALPAVVVYNANPWGSENMRRVNSLEQDINRFHISLEAVEAQYINELINSVNPAFVYDGHDTEPQDVVAQFYFITWNLLAAPAYKEWDTQFRADLAQEFSNISTELYTLDRSEGTLTNALAARGIPNCLFETLVTEPQADRVVRHVQAMKYVLNYVSRSQGALRSVRSDTRDHYRREGYAAHILSQVASDAFDVPALGYVVDGSARLSRLLHILGIESNFINETEIYVPMDQGSSPFIPWLLDPRASTPVVEAKPVFWGDDPPIDFLAKPDPLRFPTLLNFEGQEPRRLITKEGVVWGT